MSRYTEKDLYSTALQYYDIGTKPLNFEEFVTDVNRIVTLCKLIKQNKSQQKEYNLRLLLNWLIMSFNMFEQGTHVLIFSIADSVIFPELLALFIFLNKQPPFKVVSAFSGETIDLAKVQPNETMRQKLEKEVFNDLKKI